MTKAKCKTIASHQTLELDEPHGGLPLRNRLAGSKDLAETLGEDDPAFDMKTYSDKMWEES